MNRLVYGITLILMGIGGLLLAADNLAGGFLPDAAIWSIGTVDMICLPFFVYFFIKERRERRR